MSNIIPVRGKNATPRSFLDTARTYHMKDADKIFETVFPKYGKTSTDALVLAGDVGGLLTGTKRYEMDKFWSRVERTLNQGFVLKVKAKEDADKMMTGFSILYSALEFIDRSAKDTSVLAEFKSIYEDARASVSGKFVANLEGRQKRNFLTIMETVDKRLEAVGKRFNDLVDKGEMDGGKLKLTLKV